MAAADKAAAIAENQKATAVLPMIKNVRLTTDVLQGKDARKNHINKKRSESI
jgi:hypothetical protein